MMNAKEVAKRLFKWKHPDLSWGHSGTTDDESWRRFEDECLQVTKEIMEIATIQDTKKPSMIDVRIPIEWDVFVKRHGEKCDVIYTERFTKRMPAKIIHNTVQLLNDEVGEKNVVCNMKSRKITMTLRNISLNQAAGMLVTEFACFSDAGKITLLELIAAAGAGAQKIHDGIDSGELKR